LNCTIIYKQQLNLVPVKKSNNDPMVTEVLF